MWADYFDAAGIQYAFFSAANAAALQKARKDAHSFPEAEHTQSEGQADRAQEARPSSECKSFGSSGVASDSEAESPPNSESGDSSSDEYKYVHTEEDTPDGRDPRTKVLSVLELEELFHMAAPNLSSKTLTQHSASCNLTIFRVCWPDESTAHEACCWSRRLSQCRQVEHHQCPSRREESQCVFYPWKNQAFPNYTSFYLNYSV